jgi:hypothetical protein
MAAVTPVAEAGDTRLRVADSTAVVNRTADFMAAALAADITGAAPVPTPDESLQAVCAVGV